jgi:hypothetical protein
MDFREKRYRRAVFQRFYTFHLRYRSHPGGVYFALPALARHHGWDEEQRAWAAFLNGNTQNPITTSLLMEAGDHPGKADQVLTFWRANYDRLAWDTDRRYHKARLDTAVAGYLHLTRGGQGAYWRKAAVDGWPGVWAAATAIPTMGRLSAWSYLEYVRLLVTDVPDADTLLLADRDGSRSHRNGLCLVTGRDEWMWWDRNPGFDGNYPRDLVDELATEGESLLAEARRRNPGHPHVGYLTLESALCTYKSWHRPRRRYPNVYMDMMYDRLRLAESRFGDRFGPIWQARRDTLPPHLRLEDTPNDPGCVPVKQDHYLATGEVIMMERDWPCFTNRFADTVAAGLG